MQNRALKRRASPTACLFGLFERPTIKAQRLIGRERPQTDGEDVRILSAAEEASSGGACDEDKKCLNQAVKPFDNG